MGALIEDCLRIIFKFLDPLTLMTASKVCQRWDILTKNQLQKNNYSILELTSEWSDQKTYEIKFEEMINLIEFVGEHLTEVKLTLMKNNSSSDANIVLTLGSENYRCVDVTRFCIRDILQILVKNSGNISYLILGNAINFWEKIEVQNLLRMNPKINIFVRLGKFNCSESLDREFLILPATLKTLELVDVNFFNEDILKLLQKVKLKRFKFTYSGYSYAEEFKIKPIAIIYELAKQADELESFSFDYTNRTTMNIITILPDLIKMQNLQELRLSGSLNFDTNCGLYISHFCPKLRHIHLDGLQMSEQALSSILSLSDLETLTLININQSDKFYINPKNTVPHLRKLNLSFLDFYLDMKSVSKAIEKMPNLSELELPWTQKMSSNFLDKLNSITNSRDLKLKVLSLENNVQDESNFTLRLSQTSLNNLGK